jgi:hypothetical protein
MIICNNQTKNMSASRARLQRIAQQLGKFHKPKPQLREAAKKTSWNILRGDKVQVIGNHPERGKQGKLRLVVCTSHSTLLRSYVYNIALFHQVLLKQF